MNYITFLTTWGRYREAEQLLLQHLTNTVLCYPDDPDYHAQVLTLFLRLYRAAGRLEDARACGQRAIELYGKLSAYETGVAGACVELVPVYCAQGELDLAEKALDVVSRSHMFCYRTAELRVGCLLARGRPRAALLALETCRQALDGAKPSDGYSAFLSGEAGEAAFQLGDVVAGKKLLLEALAACEREHGRDSRAALQVCEKMVRLCPTERDAYAVRIDAIREKLKDNEPKGLKAGNINLPQHKNPNETGK